MEKENIFDASKQSQDKSADERLSEKELDNVAGGNFEIGWQGIQNKNNNGKYSYSYWRPCDAESGGH